MISSSSSTSSSSKSTSTSSTFSSSSTSSTSTYVMSTSSTLYLTSSSSSSYQLTQQLYHVLVGQNHYNLIPFLFYGEDDFQYTGTNLLFTFHTQYNNISYDNITSPSRPSVTTGTTYVPEKEDAYYRPDPIFYLDLITNKGTQEEIVTGQIPNTQKGNSDYTFVIPKFTWDNELALATSFSEESGYTHLTDATGSIWVGTEDYNVHKYEYNDLTVLNSYTLALDSEVKEILAQPDSDNMYITTYDHLYKYSMGHYIRPDDTYAIDVNQITKIFNLYREKIQLVNSDNVWSVVPYSNSINKRDESLIIEDKINGFDAPAKIMYSDYHGYYLIAGTTILWKWNGTTITPIYEVNDYRISDFSVSSTGEICLLLISNSESIMRILDRNLFRILYTVKINNGFFRHCDFCDNSFYAIAELQGGTSAYKLAHYVYSISDGTTTITVTENNITAYVPSSSETEATAKIQVQTPSGDVVLYNQDVTIKWVSTESITDLVKIELLKSGDVYSTIIEETTNTGVYGWKVPNTLEEGNDYKIRITLLTANANPADSGESPNVFSIVEFASSSSEQIVYDFGMISGVKFDKLNNQIVVVTKDGYLGLFKLETLEFKGLFAMDISDINCISVRNERLKNFGTISKVRVFVGSQEYLNDKWDSGEITTTLTSIYYGGGDNLIKGQTYYVNIEIYSNELGWSETQTRAFVMP